MRFCTAPFRLSAGLDVTAYTAYESRPDRRLPGCCVNNMVRDNNCGIASNFETPGLGFGAPAEARTHGLDWKNRTTELAHPPLAGDEFGGFTLRVKAKPRLKFILKLLRVVRIP